MTRARDVANIDGLLTTTGDTYYASAAGTPARLGIGSSAQVLTVASGVPSWATPSSGSTFVGCSLNKTSSQSINHATETVVTFQNELIDTDGFHSTVTNTGRITIPSGKAGKYLITAFVMVDSAGAQTQGGLFKNGTSNFTFYSAAVGSGNTGFAYIPNLVINLVLDLAVADYIECYAYQGSGSAKNVLSNAYTLNASMFSATYLGA